MAHFQAVHTVVELPRYQKIIPKFCDETEQAAIITAIAETPLTGDVMAGKGGFRKVRFGYDAKGKSGGLRIIYLHGGEDFPIFLMTAYPKNEKGNPHESRMQCFEGNS